MIKRNLNNGNTNQPLPPIENKERFPQDFTFQPTNQEYMILKRQFGTSSQLGGRRTPPYVFTDQDIAIWTA